MKKNVLFVILALVPNLVLGGQISSENFSEENFVLSEDVDAREWIEGFYSQVNEKIPFLEDALERKNAEDTLSALEKMMPFFPEKNFVHRMGFVFPEGSTCQPNVRRILLRMTQSRSKLLCYASGSRICLHRQTTIVANGKYLSDGRIVWGCQAESVVTPQPNMNLPLQQVREAVKEDDFERAREVFHTQVKPNFRKAYFGFHTASGSCNYIDILTTENLAAQNATARCHQEHSRCRVLDSVLVFNGWVSDSFGKGCIAASAARPINRR